MLPDSVLRVVSLPPTISSVRLPRKFSGLLLAQMARRRAVRHHRQQVALRRLLGALVPHAAEILGALPTARPAWPLRSSTTPPAPGIVVDTSDQRVSLRRSSHGKVEQHRQHLRRQFDRHLVDPVERLVARQVIQHLRRTLADVGREFVQMRRREHRRHGLALRTVVRLVHGDEAGAAKLHRLVADRNAAECGGRREHRVVGLDVHDVVVLGHRPVRTEQAAAAVVDRRFLAQALEVGPEGVVAEQFGIADVEVLERGRISAFACFVRRLDRAMHWRSAPHTIIRRRGPG